MKKDYLKKMELRRKGRSLKSDAGSNNWNERDAN